MGEQPASKPLSGTEVWQAKVQDLVAKLMTTWAGDEASRQYQVEIGGGMQTQTLLQIIQDPARFERFYLAFTDESFDPVNNYELLESIGDKIWGVCVGDFCFRRFAGQRTDQNERNELTTGKLSNIFSTFAAKEYQSQLGKKLFEASGIIRTGRGFPLLGGKTWRDLYEDVMEAWFGATFLICNDVDDGLGFTVCSKLAANILTTGNVEPAGNINLDKDFRDPPGKLKARFDAVKWAFEPDADIRLYHSPFSRAEVRLPSEAPDLLSRLPAQQGEGTEWQRLTNLNPSWLDGVLLSVTLPRSRDGDMKNADKAARRYLCDQALRLLDDGGLTEQWFSDMGQRFYGFRRNSWFEKYRELYDSIVKSFDLKYTYFRPADAFEKEHTIEHVTGSGLVLGRTKVDESAYLSGSYQQAMIEEFISAPPEAATQSNVGGSARGYSRNTRNIRNPTRGRGRRPVVKGF